MRPPIELAGRRHRDTTIQPLIAIGVVAIAIALLLGHHAYKRLGSGQVAAEYGREELRRDIAAARAELAKLDDKLSDVKQSAARAHRRAALLADAIDFMAPSLPGRHRSPSAVQESREVGE